MFRSFRMMAPNDAEGVRALIPRGCIWDLVEYMGNHRVRANYSYSPESFIVSFPYMDLAAARELLEGWAGVHLCSREQRDTSPLLV